MKSKKKNPQKWPFHSIQNQDSSNFDRICKILTNGRAVCARILVFYSKVAKKGGVAFAKNVSKKLNLCRFLSSTAFYLMRTYFHIMRYVLKSKHKIHFWNFYRPMYQCAVPRENLTSFDINGETCCNWEFFYIGSQHHAGYK